MAGLCLPCFLFGWPMLTHPFCSNEPQVENPLCLCLADRLILAACCQIWMGQQDSWVWRGRSERWLNFNVYIYNYIYTYIHIYILLSICYIIPCSCDESEMILEWWSGNQTAAVPIEQLWICQVLATRSMPMPCSMTSVQRTQPALAEAAGGSPALSRVYGSLMAPSEPPETSLGVE